MKALILAGALGLAACGPTATPDAGGCEWTFFIRPSVQDSLTRGTAGQIVTHNEARAEVCGVEEK